MGELTDEQLIALLKAQAKVHSDKALEMWTAYHSSTRRGRPLPWMCQQEDYRAANLNAAAERLTILSRLEDGWRPISEAPRDGTAVLIWAGDGPVIGWWETGREFPGSEHFNDWSSGSLTAGSYDAGFERIYRPTHFMPLPATSPPREG